MNTSYRTHHFSDTDYPVITVQLATGEYAAYQVDGVSIDRGHGHTRLAAIADLKEKLEAVEQE